MRLWLVLWNPNSKGRNKYWNIESSEKVVKTHRYRYQFTEIFLLLFLTPIRLCKHQKLLSINLCQHWKNIFDSKVHSHSNTFFEDPLNLSTFLSFIISDLSRSGFRKSNHGIAGVLHSSQRRLQVVRWIAEIEGENLSTD